MSHAVLRDVAVEVASAAAELVRRRRAEGFSVAATKSSAIDIVTDVDRASERLIADLLDRARPDDAQIGEEGLSRPGTSGVRWVVDPIDGTVNFLYGRPEYAVSIAAEQVDAHGVARAVAGAVVNVATGAVFEAWRGGGARRDGEALAVRPVVDLGGRLLLTGFSYEAHRRAEQARALVELLPRVRDLRRGGSCALDLCAVAAGEADGYVEEGVHHWDYAAGALIAEEAGARVSVEPGRAGGHGVLCAPRDGFDELEAAVRASGALPAGNTRA